jgi:hypothetical protein
MKKSIDLSYWLAEICLLVSVVIYWVGTASVLNPIAVALLFALMALMIWRSESWGIILSCLFLIINLYMVLALLSELNEFTVLNGNTKLLFIITGIWLVLNIVFSITMLIKWGKQASLSEEVRLNS